MISTNATKHQVFLTHARLTHQPCRGIQDNRWGLTCAWVFIVDGMHFELMPVVQFLSLQVCLSKISQFVTHAIC